MLKYDLRILKFSNIEIKGISEVIIIAIQRLLMSTDLSDLTYNSVVSFPRKNNRNMCFQIHPCKSVPESNKVYAYRDDYGNESINYCCSKRV